MTKRVYYTESYRTELQSTVTAASNDRLRIVLDQTIFYPSSGGQPHDFGTLNKIPVLDVIDEQEGITHVLAAPMPDDVAHGVIEWDRRYDHMQQHTGQHLLSAVFEELFSMPTLSFRMGEETSTIELGAKDLSAQQLKSAVLRATDLARANPKVSISFEDAVSADGLRKVSERQGTLRIIEIEGVDRSACGGTHVSSLAEVLPLQIREMEKVRGNARVSFVCGNRAMTRCQGDFELLTKLAKGLSTSFDSMESHVAALQKRLADAEKQRQHLESDAAKRAGVNLYSAADASNQDGIRRVLLSEAVIDENSRTKAKAFVSGSKAVLLMHSATDLLLACSVDSGFNAGSVLQRVLAKVGARGGGSTTLAQGSLSDPSILQDLKAVLGFQ